MVVTMVFKPLQMERCSTIHSFVMRTLSNKVNCRVTGVPFVIVMIPWATLVDTFEYQ